MYRVKQTQLCVRGGFESALKSPSESVNVSERGGCAIRNAIQKWRFVNSLPVPVFRYFSNAQAFSLLSKAIAV